MVDTDDDPRSRRTIFTADSQQDARRALWSWMEPDVLDSLLAGQRHRFEAGEVVASEAEHRVTLTGFGDGVLRRPRRSSHDPR